MEARAPLDLAKEDVIMQLYSELYANSSGTYSQLFLRSDLFGNIAGVISLARESLREVWEVPAARPDRRNLKLCALASILVRTVGHAFFNSTSAIYNNVRIRVGGSNNADMGDSALAHRVIDCAAVRDYPEVLYEDMLKNTGCIEEEEEVLF